MTGHEDEDHTLLVTMAQLHMAPPREGKDAELHALVASADEDDLINAAVFGRLCLCLIALKDHDVPTGGALFAWCEARWTERAEEFFEITVELLLSLYALLILNVREEPRVPFTQVTVFVDALMQRHRQYGFGMRSPYLQAHLTARARDDDTEAETYFRYLEAEPDEPDSQPVESVAMSWLRATGRWEAVLDRYRSALRDLAENPDHAWVAEYVHAEALEALVALGRLDDARAAFRLGVAAVDAEHPSLEAVGLLLGHCAQVDRLDDGLALLAKYLPELAETHPAGYGVEFCQYGAVLTQRLRAAGRGGDAVLPGRTLDDVDTELRAWAIDFAETVDRVNATDIGRRRLARFWSARAVELPVSG